jgi:hypothetical protein
MTKRLEEVLNLPENKKMVYDDNRAADVREQREEARKAAEVDPLLRDFTDFDKISAALPQVKGLGEISDKELDALAKRATDAFDDLMDLGMNVEARYSGRVFEVAGTMLKNAIDAKSAKIDKKLKMIELQIKKQAIDQKAGSADDNVVHGEGVIVTDRNSLLEKLKNMNK